MWFLSVIVIVLDHASYLTFNPFITFLRFLQSSLIGVIYTTSILDCEVQDSYWLTVYATDRGVVPLSSSIEVFIEVQDVNDNAPLSSDPVYHPYIMENSPKDVSVVRVQAQDPDVTAFANRLTYRITAGNPQNFFTINSKTGEKLCHLTGLLLRFNT